MSVFFICRLPTPWAPRNTKQNGTKYKHNETAEWRMCQKNDFVNLKTFTQYTYNSFCKCTLNNQKSYIFLLSMFPKFNKV